MSPLHKGCEDLLMQTLASYPAPPLIDRLLFESPVLVPVAVLVLAILIALGMSRAGRGRQGWIVIGVGVLVGAALAVSARAVETDREAIENGTRDFIDAVVSADEQAVEELLAPRLTLMSGGTSSPLNARSFILGNLERIRDDIEQHSAGVQEAAVTVENAGKSKFVFRVHRSRSFGAGLSTWVLDWQNTPGEGWQINAIDLVAINGNPVLDSVFSRMRF